MVIFFQMRVRATDSGGLSSTGTVVVNINRNLNDPEWIQTSYSQTIDENYPFLSTILTFTARDFDSQAPHNTLVYTISSNNLANNYFQIVGNDLYIRNSLVGANTDRFEVSVHRSRPHCVVSLSKTH